MAHAHETQAKISLLKKTHATHAKGLGTVRNILRVQSETFCVYSQKHSACAVRNIPTVPAKKGFFSIKFARIATICALLFCVCGATRAWAQQKYTWTGNGGNTNWTTPGNWEGGIAPAGTAVVEFTGNATVTLNTNRTNNGLEFKIAPGSNVTINPPTGTTTYFQINPLSGLDTSFKVSSGTLNLNVSVTTQIPVEVVQYATLNFTGNGTLTLSGQNITVTNSGNITLNSLTLAQGQTLTANAGSTLRVNNTFTNNGGLVNINDGTVSAQTVANSANSSVVFGGDSDINISSFATKYGNLSVFASTNRNRTITFNSTTEIQGSMNLRGNSTYRTTVKGTNSANIVLPNNTTGKGEWLDIDYDTVSINGGTGATYDVSTNCLGKGATATGNQRGWMFSQPTSSNVYYWAGGGNNNWSTAANWRYDNATGTVAAEYPGTNVDAQVHIEPNAATTVTLDVSLDGTAGNGKQIKSITLNSNATLNIGNNNLTVTDTWNNTGTVNVNGNANITLPATAASVTENGTWIYNATRALVNLPNGYKDLQIGDGNTTPTVSLDIAGKVSGALTVQQKATLTLNAGSTLTVTGTWSNTGTVNVKDNVAVTLPNAAARVTESGKWVYNNTSGTPRDLVIPYNINTLADRFFYKELEIARGEVVVPANQNVGVRCQNTAGDGKLTINQGATFTINGSFLAHNRRTGTTGGDVRSSVENNGTITLGATNAAFHAAGNITNNGTIYLTDGTLNRNYGESTFNNKGTIYVDKGTYDKNNNGFTENGTWIYENTTERGLISLRNDTPYTYKNLQIGNGTSTTPIKLTANVTASAVTVSDKSTLDLVGYNVNGATTIENNSTIKLHGTQTVAGTKDNKTNSTVEFYGTGNADISKMGTTFHHLKVTATAARTVTFNGTTTVSGNMTLTGTSSAIISINGSNNANIILSNNSATGTYLWINYNNVSINATSSYTPTYDVTSNCFGPGGAQASGVQKGWLFSNVISSDVYYWVGGTGNWSDFRNHWRYDDANGPANANEYPGTNPNAKVYITSGAVTLSETPTNALASIENAGTLTINNGINLTANVAFANNGTLNNNGIITINGTVNNTRPVTNNANSSVVFGGNSNINISNFATTYGNVTVNAATSGSGRTITFSGDTTIQGTMTLSGSATARTTVDGTSNANIIIGAGKGSGTYLNVYHDNVKINGGNYSPNVTYNDANPKIYDVTSNCLAGDGSATAGWQNGWDFGGTLYTNFYWNANAQDNNWTNPRNWIVYAYGNASVVSHINTYPGANSRTDDNVYIGYNMDGQTAWDTIRLTKNTTITLDSAINVAVLMFDGGVENQTFAPIKVTLNGNGNLTINANGISFGNGNPTDPISDIEINVPVTTNSVSFNSSVPAINVTLSKAFSVTNSWTNTKHTVTVASAEAITLPAGSTDGGTWIYTATRGIVQNITYNNLQIGDGTATPKVTLNDAVNANGTITVQNGSTFELQANAVTVTTAITNNGTIRLHGTQTITGNVTNNTGSTVEFYGDTGATPINVSQVGTDFVTLKCDMSGGGEKVLDFSNVTKVTTLDLNGNSINKLGITAATPTRIALGTDGSGSYLRVNYTNVELTGKVYDLTSPADNSVGTDANFNGDYTMQGEWSGWRFSTNDAFSVYYWNPSVSSGAWVTSTNWLVEFPYGTGKFIAPPDGSFPNNATSTQPKQAFFGAGTAIPAVRITGNVVVDVSASISLRNLDVRLPSGASVTFRGSGEINVANNFIFENEDQASTSNHATLTTNVNINSTPASTATARVSYAANLIVGTGATATFSGSFDGAGSTAPIVTVNGKATFNSYGSAAQPIMSALVINDGGSVTANAWHNAGTVTLNGSTSTAAVTLGGGSESGTWIYNNTSGNTRNVVPNFSNYNNLVIQSGNVDISLASDSFTINSLTVKSGASFTVLQNGSSSNRVTGYALNIEKNAEVYLKGFADFLTGNLKIYSNEGTIILGENGQIMPSSAIPQIPITEKGKWIYDVGYNGIIYYIPYYDLELRAAYQYKMNTSSPLVPIQVANSIIISNQSTLEIDDKSLIFNGAASGWQNSGNVTVTSGNATFANAVTDGGTWTYNNTASRNLISNNITYNNLKLSGTGTITALNNFTVRDTMNIGTNATLALGERTLTLASGGTWQNSGTVTVGNAGNATFTGADTSAENGTWIYNNTSARNGVVGLTYNNVQFAGNAVTLATALTAKNGGSITVGSATNSNTSLNTNGNAINASGAYITNYGTTDLAGSSVTADSFTNNSRVRLTGRGTNTITTVTNNNNSAVEYYGTDAAVRGAATLNFGTDYYDFVCTTGGKTLLFDRDISVRNNLTLRGVDFDNLITIRSSDDNTVRYIRNVTNTTGQFVRVDRDKVRFNDSDGAATPTNVVFEDENSFDYREASLTYQSFRGWYFKTQTAPSVFYWTGKTNNNWNEGSNWTGIYQVGGKPRYTTGLAPTATDHSAFFGGSAFGVTYPLTTDANVNIDAPVNIKQITFTLGTASAPRNVTLSGTNSITVGSMTSVDGNTGTVNANVNISTTGTSGQTDGLIVHNGVNYNVSAGAKTTVNSSVSNRGNITVNGEFECTNYGVANVPASGTLTVNGTGTFTARAIWNNQGTVEINDTTTTSAAITLPTTAANITEKGVWIYSNTNTTARDLVNIPYNNLQIANGQINTALATTVNGTLTMGRASPAANGTLNVNNAFTTNSVTYDTADSKIVIGNGNSLTVTNAFNNARAKNPTASTDAADAALQIGSGAFTLNASASWNNSGIVSVVGGTADFQTTGTVTDNGTWLYANGGNRALIQNISYNNLYLHGTAANEITVPADFTVRGAVEINSDTTLLLNDRTLTLPQTATWKNVGKVNVSTGTLNVATAYALEDDGIWTYTANRNAAKGLAKIRYTNLVLESTATPTKEFDLAANDLFADSITIGTGSNVRLVGTQTIARKNRTGTPNVKHGTGSTSVTNSNTKIEYYGSDTATLALADNQSVTGQNTYYDLFVDMAVPPSGTAPATGGKTVNVNSDITVANELRLNGTVANRLTVTKTGTGTSTITLTDPTKSTGPNPSASNNKNNYLRVDRDSVYITGTNPLGTGGANSESYYFVSYYSENVTENYNSVWHGWYFPDIESYFWWSPRGANREWSDSSNWIVGSSTIPSTSRMTATHAPGQGNYVYFDTRLITSTETIINLNKNIEVNEFNVHTGVELTVNLNGRTLSVATDGTKSTSVNPNTNSGTLTLNGGTFAIMSGAAYKNGDSSTANAGTIKINDNAIITVAASVAGGANAGTFTNTANSTIDLSGSINNAGAFTNDGTVNVNSATANFTNGGTATENGTWIYNVSRPNGLINYSYENLQIGSAGQQSPVVVDLAGRDLAANSITNNGTVRLYGTQTVSTAPANISNATGSTVEFYSNTGATPINVSMMGTAYDNLTITGNKNMQFPTDTTVNGDLYLTGNANNPLTIAASGSTATITVNKAQGDNTTPRGNYLNIDRVKVTITGATTGTTPSGIAFVYWADNSYDTNGKYPDALSEVRGGWRIPVLKVENVVLSVSPLGGNNLFVRSSQNTMNMLSSAPARQIDLLRHFFKVVDSSGNDVSGVSISAASLVRNGSDATWIRLTPSITSGVTLTDLTGLQTYYVATATNIDASGALLNITWGYHPISDFAVGASRAADLVTPLFAYDNRYQSSGGDWRQYSENSLAIRNWNKDQGNDGSLMFGNDITLSVNFASSTGTPQIYLTNDSVSSGFLNRVWSPTNWSNLVPVPSSVNPTGTATGNNVRYDFTNATYTSNWNWKDGDQVSFMFGVTGTNNALINVGGATIGGQTVPSHPLYALRLQNANDINSLDVWSFRLRTATAQRGGVSILNNVIDANSGERVTVQVDMKGSGPVNVIVMTLDGDVVTYLHHGSLSSGKHLFQWDGRTNGGRTVARGLYWVRVTGSGFDETRKVLVIKE